MSWTAHVLTLFPEMFPGSLGHSLAGRALEQGLWHLETHNIRDYATDRHRTVDDTPFGGGSGMVMRPDVVNRAIESAAAKCHAPHFVFMTPRGKPLTQGLLDTLKTKSETIILCGHFEGIDQRVIEAWPFDEVSLGDYILSGGEVAATVLMDGVVRLLPGVIGNAASLKDESFSDALLEYPHYTRPQEWEGKAVPPVLLSGHHQQIATWRREQAEKATAERRPDLLQKRGKPSEPDSRTLFSNF